MTSRYIWMVIGFGVEFATPAVILILITNIFDPDTAGAWIVFTAILLTATKLREGVTENTLIKFSAGKSNSERWSAYNALLVVSFVIELVSITGITTFGWFFKEGTLGRLLLFYPILSVSQIFVRWIRVILTSEIRPQKVTFLNATVLALFCILYIIFRHDLANLVHFLYLYAASQFFTALLFIKVVRFTPAWNIKYLKSVKKSFIEYGINGLIRELLGTLSSRAFVFLSAGYVSMSAGAFTGIALQYSKIIHLINTAYQSLLYPQACDMVEKGLTKRISAFLIKSQSRLFAFFLLFITGFIAAFWFIIPFIHGPEYIEALPYFLLLAISGAFISPMGHLFGSFMHAIHKPREVTRLITINSALNLILSLSGVMLFGVWGTLAAPVIIDFFALFWVAHIFDKYGYVNMWNVYLKIGSQLQLFVYVIKKSIRKLST